MSAGMAKVIAAHRDYILVPPRGEAICTDRGCGWRHAAGTGQPEAHAAHVAEELTKAGYGLVRT